MSEVRKERYPEIESGIWPSAPAYAAGFMDGEGSIVISTRKRRVKQEGLATFTVMATAWNTNQEVLAWLQERWGGYLSKARQYETSHLVKKRVQPVYAWAVAGRASRFFLLDILPFLIVKRPQAENALKLLMIQSDKKGHGLERYMEEVECYRTHVAFNLNRGRPRKKYTYLHDTQDVVVALSSRKPA